MNIPTQTRGREYDLWIAWCWNDSARDLAKDLAKLQKAVDQAKGQGCIPFSTVLLSRDLVRNELTLCRHRVAEECAPWFDGSAFIAASTTTREGR